MIPVAKPYFNKLEEQYLNEAIKSGMITFHGKFIPEFEDKFKSYLGTNYALSCSNGTTALHLCLLALGIKPGDEVITTPLTYASTAFAISYCGAKPIFVDIGEDWNIDTTLIENSITSNTKAIIAVHLYGHACDMANIMKIAKKYNLYVVEDCAEALGAKSVKNLHTVKVGSIGDISSFSFFGNKIITTGEGGMVVTNNENLYEKAKYYCCQAQSNIRYYHTDIGYNYRMTNLQAAIGVAQLEKLSLILDRRKVIRDQYNKNLSGLSLKLMSSSNHDVNWLYSLEIEERNILCNRLSKVGIDSRPFFMPLHSMPMYLSKSNFPKAELCSNLGINLPTFCDLTLDEVDIISSIVRKHAELYHS